MRMERKTVVLKRNLYLGKICPAGSESTVEMAQIGVKMNI